MKLPRWLTADFSAALTRIDDKFQAERRNGPLLIEVHYRGGRPQIGRVRDILLAPVLLELTVAMCATTS